MGAASSTEAPTTCLQIVAASWTHAFLRCVCLLMCHECGLTRVSSPKVHWSSWLECFFSCWIPHGMKGGNLLPRCWATWMLMEHHILSLSHGKTSSLLHFLNTTKAILAIAIQCHACGMDSISADSSSTTCIFDLSTRFRMTRQHNFQPAMVPIEEMCIKANHIAAFSKSYCE